MLCPNCKNVSAPKKVVSTNILKSGVVKRKRKCKRCNGIFRTIEKPIVEKLVEKAEDGSLVESEL